ncbi:multiprotein-bridging factor 1 family protein [Kribbella sp. NPDC051586]|uniref:multiprotein-bridging factor 1 family protein n=1 Tax=Kribbella sp. NPDC051586 TaxID=3364118 RepID=UPI0037B33EB6
MVNEALRKAMYGANLTEADVATEVAVDPKTVRNWLRGQLPHARHRARLTKLLGIDEDLAWPELSGARQPDLVAVYPRRTVLPFEFWLSLFGSAVSEIGIVANDAAFLLQYSEILRCLRERCATGTRVRIGLRALDLAASAVGDLDADTERAVADPRRALARLQPLLPCDGFEVRLYSISLYNSLYVADDQLLVNQHAFGIAEAESPVFHYRRSAGGDLFRSYLASFETIWSQAESPRAFKL